MKNSLSLNDRLVQIKPYKQLLLFPVKAVCIYYVLKYLYLGYVGLVDPKGTYDYSVFFEDWNLITFITDMHILVSDVILNLIGYATEVKENTLHIKGSNGVRIHYACLGIELWISLIALVFSYPISITKIWQTRLIGALVGIFVIFLFNNIRVVTIILTNHYNHDIVHAIHDGFNYVVYTFIFVFFYFWINAFPFSREGK